MRTMKSFVLPVALAASFVGTAFAQTAVQPTAQTQSNRKVKNIKLTLSNKSANSIALKSGDNNLTLAAGESRSMQVPSGTRIVTTEDSSAGQAGTVITEVTDGMNGSTVNLR